MTERQVIGLMHAYRERKRWEARILIATLGEAMAPKSKQMSLAQLAGLGFKVVGNGRNAG